jgi:ribonuclease HI
MEIYTDGACSGNPGKGAYAFVAIRKNTLEIFSGFEEYTTNNRMELKAIIEAIKYASEKHEKAIIFTDSNYVYNAIKNKKVERWIAIGHAKNLDLWQEFAELSKNIEFEIEKVAGHKNVIGNNLADKIAKYTIKIFSK